VPRTRKRRPPDETRAARFLRVRVALAAAIGLAGFQVARDASARVEKLRLRVGETRRLAAPPADVGARFVWFLDGRPLPVAGPVWEYAPRAADTGTHRLKLRIIVAKQVTTRTWGLRVEPPRAPSIVMASPTGTSLVLGPGESVDLVLRARPAAPAETVQTSWTVDGRPAGEGDRLRVPAPVAGTVRARALVVGSLGAAVAREWTISARATALAAASATTLPLVPPTTSSTAPPPPSTSSTTTSSTAPPTLRSTSSIAPLPPTTSSTATTAPAPLASSTSTSTRPTLPPSSSTTTTPPVAVATAAPPTTTPPRAAAADADVTARDVEAFIQRYAAAWQHHDAAELRRLGQVSSDSQEAALRDYFARTPDLDVQVTILDVFSAGERHTVRFTRRDRFRDPTGRVVTKETPPLEKEVVRTASGLRFAPATR
jgi:hypothetical protein